MIHSVKCDKPSFRTVNFKPGFNLIVAERTKKATKKDSRNGLGKSTLVEIIHFCLGGNKGETLSKKELDDWTFTVDLDLSGKRYSVTRNTDKQKDVTIEGDCSDWDTPPSRNAKTGKQTISRNDWTKQLGILTFGLDANHPSKHAPTFRSLISYFARKNGQSGAFLNPFQQHKSQLEWDKQANNSFLLGLDWEYASRLQDMKDRLKTLNQLKKESDGGIVSDVMGNVGELEALRIRLESQANQEKKDLDNFKVHQQYSRIEQDANHLTKEIQKKVNQQIEDKRYLEHYHSSLNQETDAKPENIIRIYEEAGLTFAESTTKKISEVLSFHEKIVSNRKEFLNSEIKRITERTKLRESQIKEADSKKAKLMATLKSHGALNEHNQMMERHQATIADLNDASKKLDNLKKFEQEKSTLKVKQESLVQQAKADLNERSRQRQKAVLTFNSYSNKMYSAPGTLSINMTETGFKFDVKIERSGSQGISNMEIFCYDLMIAKLWSKKAPSPIFLIHDSMIFDGVDERQKALALKLAKSESEKENFQYICNMNSDSMPKKELEGFDIESSTTETFTDDKPDGGLLGIRF